MAVVKFFSVAAVILYGCLVSCFSFEEVDVSASCSNSSAQPCSELDDALEALDSSATLLLQPGGVHILHENHMLVGIDDISIVGEDLEPVWMRCESGVGLAFVNMDNLAISNVVISGCGLTGTPLHDVTELVKEFVNLTFFVPDSVKIAVFLAQCTNLSISDSVIANTSGLGMLGINIGNSTLSRVDFTNNKSPNCSQRNILFPYNVTTFGGIGGGAYFLYQDVIDSNEAAARAGGDVTLTIADCNFEHNAECSLAGFINVNYPYLTQYPNSRYTIGAGGGLSLFTPQVTYSVQAFITDSNFNRNHACYGAGAHIGLFIGTTVNLVHFMGCSFNENGSPLELEYPYQVNGGAGVALFLDMLRSEDVTDRQSPTCNHCKSINFTSTNFTGNSAISQGGGVMAYILSKQLHVLYNSDYLDAVISFAACVFSGNSAKYGSALHISQRVLLGADGHWSVGFDDVLVVNNTPTYACEDDGRNFSNDQISAVDLRGIVAVIFGGNLTIRENSASGIHLMSSLLILSSNTALVLQKNKARRGGGVYMNGKTPLIVISMNCVVVFDSNSASSEGGAIFYESHLNQQGILEPFANTDCFITPSASYLGANGSGMFDSNITIIFTDNHAPIGSIVYGSSLNSCTWANAFNLSNESLYSELHSHYNSTFVFGSEPRGKEHISTDPHSIKVVNGSGLSAYPGQLKPISLDLLDVFLNEVEAVITSDTPDKSRNDITVGRYGFWYYIDEVGAYVYARGRSDEITVSLYTASNLVSTNFTITILDCPVGFNYDNDSQICICDEIFSDNKTKGVECDQENIQLNVSNAKWMGCENENCTTSDLIVLECYFQYCDYTVAEHVFNESDPSTQCAKGSHRTGLMCGKCKDGYSALYGVNRCGGECSNKHLGLFLFLHIVLGLFVFIMISLLGITIDKGWTNMVILFGNVVFPYKTYDNSPIRYLFLPARWLSLELGLSICAYDEMDALGDIGLTLLFPAYMYLLMLIFAVLCRYISFFGKYFYPTKTLVTLIFLLYVHIFKTCITILAAVYIRKLDGSTDGPFRWLEDPNVQYFQGWHCVLGIVAIVLFLGYIIWFPLVLLSPTLAYKHGSRYKPFLDAIWAPFKPKLRIWASVRLILRIVIVMVPRFAINTLFRGITLNSSLLVVFLYLQAMIQPFNDRLIHVIDCLLILTSLFLYASALFNIPNGQPNMSGIDGLEIFFVSFFLSISYIAIIGTFVWYARKSENLKAFMNCVCKLRRKMALGDRIRELRRKRLVSLDKQRQVTIQNTPTHSSISIAEPERGFLSSRYRNFTKPRESLLDERSL